MREPDPTSPHAEYDQYVARSERRAAWWRRAGRIAFYVFGAALALIFAWLTVAATIDLGEPRYWGTYTQTDCEPRVRGGCRSVGVWVSDDRSIVKSDVYLDGWPNPDGGVRASYQPTGVINDERNNVVHAEELTGLGPFAAGLGLIGWTGYVLSRAVKWGDLQVAQFGPRRRRATRDSSARAMTRRQYRDNMRDPVQD